MSGEKQILDNAKLSEVAKKLNNVGDKQHVLIHQIAKDLTNIFQDNLYIEKDFAVAKDLESIANRLEHQVENLKKLNNLTHYKVMKRDLEYAKKRLTYLLELDFVKKMEDDYPVGGFNLKGRYKNETASLDLEGVGVKKDGMKLGDTKVLFDDHQGKYLEADRRYVAHAGNAHFVIVIDKQGVMHIENIKGTLDKSLSFDVETHYKPKAEKTGGITVKSHMSLSLDEVPVKKKAEQKAEEKEEEVEEVKEEKQEETPIEENDDERVPHERSLITIQKSNKGLTETNKDSKLPTKTERKSLDDYFEIFDDDADKAKNSSTRKATISDVERVYREKAEHEAEELLRKEYEAIERFKFKDSKTWSTPLKRLKMYWMRGERKNDAVKATMKMYKEKKVDLQHGEVTSAADRHEKMYTHWNENDNIEKVADGMNIPEVDALSKRYLTDASLNDAEFEKQFNLIISKNSYIKKALNKNVNYSASNILLKLRAEKHYRALIHHIGSEVQAYAAKPDAAAYTAAVKKHVDAYVSATHSALTPNLQKALLAPANVDKYKSWISHERALLKIQTENLKIKLDILKGGKGAYEVDNKDRNKNVLAKLGALMDERPKTTLAVSIGGSVIAGLLTGGTGLAVVATSKAMVGIAAKKAAHMTKEQLGEEKRLTRSLDSEKARLENLKKIMDAAPAWKKYGLGLGSDKEYKATRQYQLYGQTTQYEFMADTDKTYDALKNAIVSNDKEAIRKQSAVALARFDYYAKSGHNFFGQQKDAQMEEKMNALQILVLSSVLQADSSLESIRAGEEYKNTYGEVDSGYSDASDTFKSQRAILATKYALSAGAMSLGLQYLLGTGLFDHGHPADAGDALSEGIKEGSKYPVTKLHSEIIEGFNLDANQVHNLESWFNNASAAQQHNPNAFWTAIHDIKVPSQMSEHTFNEMKNNFMGKLAWKMQEGGSGIAELVSAPARLALDTNASGYHHAMNFLVRHGICEQADGPTIVRNLAQVKAGTMNPTTLPADMQRKMAEYCYMFLHKDPSQGLENGLLKASFHTDWMQNPADTIVHFTKGGHGWRKSVKNVVTALGVPFFANTFLEDVKLDPKAEKAPKKSLIEKMKEKIPGRKKAQDAEDTWNPDIIVDPRKNNIDAPWLIKDEDAKLFTGDSKNSSKNNDSNKDKDSKNNSKNNDKSSGSKGKKSVKNADGSVTEYDEFNDTDEPTSSIINYGGRNDEDVLETEINETEKKLKLEAIKQFNEVAKEYVLVKARIQVLQRAFIDAKSNTDLEKKLGLLKNLQKEYAAVKKTVLELIDKTVAMAKKIKSKYPQNAKKLEELSKNMTLDLDSIRKVINEINTIVTEMEDKEDNAKVANTSPINILTDPVNKIVQDTNVVKSNKKKLELLKQRGLLSPIVIDGKSYDYFVYKHRPIVHIKMGNLVQPFYLSTGIADKKDVAKNKWYPFFGISSEDGWLNKSSSADVNINYKRPIFKKISAILNDTLDSNPENYKIHADKDGNISNLQDDFVDTYTNLWSFSKPAARGKKAVSEHIHKVLTNIDKELLRLQGTSPEKKGAPSENKPQNSFEAMKDMNKVKEHLLKINKEYHLLSFTKFNSDRANIQKEGLITKDRFKGAPTTNLVGISDIQDLTKRMSTEPIRMTGIIAVPRSAGNSNKEVMKRLKDHGMTKSKYSGKKTYINPKLNVGFYDPQYKNFSFESSFQGDLSVAKNNIKDMEQSNDTSSQTVDTAIPFLSLEDVKDDLNRYNLGVDSEGEIRAKKGYDWVDPSNDANYAVKKIDDSKDANSDNTENVASTVWEKGKKYTWTTPMGVEDEVKLIKIKNDTLQFEVKSDGRTDYRTLDQLKDVLVAGVFEMIQE